MSIPTRRALRRHDAGHRPATVGDEHFLAPEAWSRYSLSYALRREIDTVFMVFRI